MSLKNLLAEVAQYYGITSERMMSLSRAHDVSHPRQAFMWHARQVKWPDGSPRYSLPQIAGFLGGMNHTTVLHGIRRHETRLQSTDSSTRSLVWTGSDVAVIRRSEEVHG